MSDSQKPTKREPRKKPKISLLQVMFLIAAAGVILMLAHQHGGF